MILLPGPDVPVYGDTVLTVDGLLVNVEVDGVTWVFESIDGWRGGAGAESTMSNRPAAHGLHDGPTLRRGRVISVTGVCVAPTRVLAEQCAELLASTLADGSMGSFTTASPIGVRTAQVRLSDAPQVTFINPVTFRWQMQFTAPDWRKYGEDQFLSTSLPGGGGALVFPIGAVFDFGDPGSSGSVTVTNTGTAASEPVFSVQGPLAVGFQVTYAETGQRLRYEGPVADPVLIDCASGLVTAGGQDRLGLLTVDEFFSVPAGQSATFQFATLGSETSDDPALMTARFAPAYA